MTKSRLRTRIAKRNQEDFLVVPVILMIAVLVGMIGRTILLNLSPPLFSRIATFFVYAGFSLFLGWVINKTTDELNMFEATLISGFL
jgi:uncharacterized protein YacL